jgi:putative ABC transport system permease protein
MTFTVNDKADVITKAERGKSRWELSSPFEEKLRTALSPAMQFDKSDNRALWVNSQADEYEQQQGVMNAIRLFVLIIGICTLISGAVGVSNIMLVSVRERTKEFGIRKAIGAPPATILTTVVGESILITAMFGYIGMFVGIGIMELINRFVPQGDFPFRNPTVDIPAVAIATFILIIVGVIAGAIPAIKAMKIKPIEALNYEK